MTKRIFAALMCMAAVLALLPKTAQAAGAASVTVNGVVLDGTAGKTYYQNGNDATSGATGNASNWNARFDSANHTLYLNGLSVSDCTADPVVNDPSGHRYYTALYADGELTVDVTGDNSVSTAHDNTGIISMNIAVFIRNGSLTVRGSGQLTATAGDAARGNSYGVRVEGNIDVSGATLSGTSGYGYGSVSGVLAYGSSYITVHNGGTLVGTSGDADENTLGVNAGNITVNGGSLTGVCGNGARRTGTILPSAGVFTRGNITLIAGSLTGRSPDDSDSAGAGTQSPGTISVSGGTFTAQGVCRAVNRGIINGADYSYEDGSVTLGPGVTAGMSANYNGPGTDAYASGPITDTVRYFAASGSAPVAAPNVPKTGDNAPLFLLCGLILLSGAGLSARAAAHRRRNGEDSSLRSE